MASLTYTVTVALHLFPVFQVHGPDVALEQARGVRNCVCPCAAETQAVESDSALKCTLSNCFDGRLPSSSFAFLIRKGDVQTLVVDVNKWPGGAGLG